MPLIIGLSPQLHAVLATSYSSSSRGNLVTCRHHATDVLLACNKVWVRIHAFPAISPAISLFSNIIASVWTPQRFDSSDESDKEMKQKRGRAAFSPLDGRMYS